MKQFNELMGRVESLEEVVRELQQRMGMMEQAGARKDEALERLVSRESRRRPARRRAQRVELESGGGAESADR